MKKKTVITTEKHEVWVVREGIPELDENQTIDVSNTIEVPLPDSGFQESSDSDSEEEK